MSFRLKTVLSAYSCVLAVSFLMVESSTPAKLSVLANFCALSDASIISPDRFCTYPMAVCVTDWNTPASAPAFRLLNPLFAPSAYRSPACRPSGVVSTLPNASLMLLPTFFMLGTICT